MPVFICNYCNKSFIGRNRKNRINTYCSRDCQGRHSSELQSDGYTVFRHMYRKAKSYAKRKGRDFSITLDDIKYIWEKQNGCCNLTGIKLKFGDTDRAKQHGGSTASLDRINSSLGYIPGNIQIIHKALQDIKSDLDDNVFICWSTLIGRHRGASVDADSLDDTGYTIPVVDDDPNFVPF